MISTAELCIRFAVSCIESVIMCYFEIPIAHFYGVKRIYLQIRELCKVISEKLRMQEKLVPWKEWCGIR